MNIIEITQGMQIYIPERIRNLTIPTRTLEESFKKYGILLPLILIPSADGNYFLVDGAKRLSYYRHNKCPLKGLVLDISASLNPKLFEAIFNNTEGFTTVHKLELADLIISQSASLDTANIDMLVGFTPGGYLMAKSVIETDLYSLVQHPDIITGKDIDKFNEYKDEMLLDEISIKKANQLVQKLITTLTNRDKKKSQQADDEMPDLSLKGFDDVPGQTVKELVEFPVPADKRFIQLERSNYTCSGCGLHGDHYKQLFKVVRELPDYLGGSDATLDTLCPTCEMLMEKMSIDEVDITEAVRAELPRVVELAEIRALAMSESEYEHHLFVNRFRKRYPDSQ